MIDKELREILENIAYNDDEIVNQAISQIKVLVVESLGEKEDILEAMKKHIETKKQSGKLNLGTFWQDIAEAIITEMKQKWGE